MRLSADAPFSSRPAPNLAAGALALGVHAVFVLLLVFGVSWQTQHPAPVMVDLWQALPTDAPVPAVEPPPPPEPAPRPAPVKAEPPSPPAVQPQPVKSPDIALEKKKADAEQLKKLKAMQVAEDKALADATRKDAEAARLVRDKQMADKKKRDVLRQMEEDELMQRMADEEAANEARLIKQAEARAAAQAAASKRQAELSRLVGQHRDQISAKVRGNTRLPDSVTGNPEVRCLVKLLPTGEVMSVKVTQSSGNVAYDEAVKRAIEKSSPLPLPTERDARAAFVPELTLIHRPKE